MSTRGTALLPLLFAALFASCLGTAPAAEAAFGFLPGSAGFNVTATAEGGRATTDVAGSHPYSLVTEVNFNKTGNYTDGDLRNLTLDLPPGLVENPTAVPRCSLATFSTPRASDFESPSLSGENCPDLTQVGTATLRSSYGGGETRTFGVFNLAPQPGALSELGFSPYGIPVTLTPRVREEGGEYGLSLEAKNFSQQLDVSGLKLTIWGNPWAISHNDQRGSCLNEANPAQGWAKCPVAPLHPSHAAQAYLTLPTSCEGPLSFHVSATSWQGDPPAQAASTSAENLSGCDTVQFNPTGQGRLNTDRTNSPTGFVFSLEGNSASLLDPTLQAPSQARQAVVTLAEGMTVNPSVAAGLSTCSEAQFAAETVSSAPGAGCPLASKVGRLKVESPILEKPIEGSMFFATPGENRFGTLLALYLVAKAPDRGIMVKVAGKVVPDPATGRLVATFDDLPQIPYSFFDVEFREGQRSPLASPSACGSYLTEIDTRPWSNPSAVKHQISPFSLTAGAGGGPCPGALAPFHPGAIGGMLNSNASSYTPFYLHLTRDDSEQEITSYSATLPPGVLGKLAGIPFCSDADIAAARAQSGAASAAAPACPPATRIGRTYTGYGVGGTLAYAPGGLYLAGPYHGSPLSVVAIDSAKVGPFDLGTVVIRSAIRIDRQTAQVSIDSAGSDPIPHILQGLPLRLRDIRIYIDRPGFMLNPTSCNPFSVVSTLTGAGARFSDPGDDQSSSSSSPFQASNCVALNFNPQFSLALRGGHKRGDFPALRATVRPLPGESNIGAVTVVLPPKLFLAQGHLETVCTLRQFAAHACPGNAVYGWATAVTPLLDEPMSGPVYLRSNGSERALPDLVAALSGRGIEIDLVGKIDSHKGGLRARFDVLPDAPITSFTMGLRGGKRSLITNATNTCVHRQVASTRLVSQSNVAVSARVPLAVKCKKGKHRKRGKSGKSRGAKR
jgi:hypothetical protein